MIIDAVQRQRAVDPGHSYAVTAPAGSGKTELLTQRFLALLAVVDQPESILAITFTRKAVAEMRSRILRALIDAKQLAKTVAPEAFENALTTLAPHRRQTMQLAHQALLANQHNRWGLLENPSRLRVYTFDAFSASLARQMPFASGFGGVPQQAEDMSLIYKAAVDRALLQLGSSSDYSVALELLLNHLDCRADRLHAMLVDLLRKRDQWRLLFDEFSAGTESALERLSLYLREWTEGIVVECAQLLRPHEDRLCELQRFAAENLNQQDGSDRRLFDCLPPATPEHLADWAEIAEFLLTKDSGAAKFRSRVDKRQGFPPKSTKPAPKFTSNDFRDLVSDISLDSAVAAATVAEVRLLPDENSIVQQQEFIAALLTVMRLSMAYLEIEFQKTQQVDFVATSIQSLLAIEDESDLALRLDYQIKHLLVDEFQDTSQIQYDLLAALCREWCSDPEANRSMFFVGDAMQSIYSFRNARVGLFMNVRKNGLAGYPIEELCLQSNFRSRPAVIDWVNNCFTNVFPVEDDLRLGACSYVAAYVPDANPNDEFSIPDSDPGSNVDSAESLEASPVQAQRKILKCLVSSMS